MISIRNLLFLAVAVTGSVIKRDADIVRKDLEIVNSDTIAVTKAVNNYNVAQEAIPILNAQRKLTADIKTATNNANRVKATPAEAEKIIDYITNVFQGSISSALNALKAKKDNFKKDGLTDSVKKILKDLKSDSSNYSDALIAGTPAGLQEKARGIKKDIIKKFDDAINAFP
ncbi:hypothetical protein EsDP_00000705 [Epichloe bromicola]|uniref:Hydrophobic surface binding protein n=1 Tax=Epichloe bromicola TaxID=79588 RepID=A0ABQ0CFR2_9HYPO